jgi:hypothetical protein
MVCLPTPIKIGYALTSVAGCGECIAPAAQDSSRGEVNATQGNSAAAFHAPEDNLSHIGSASLSTPNNGKKRRRSSSGGVQGNLSNPRGPKIARVMRRAQGKAKGKQAQKADSPDANSSPSEEKSDRYSQEGRDQEAGPCMFAEMPAQRFADDIRCSLKAQTTI